MLVIGMILTAKQLIMLFPHSCNASETNQTLQPQIKRAELLRGTM